jgi:hypothetical protein
VLGARPYENGYGSEVLQLPWRRGSIYSPPSDWFHQHFNTGAEPARQIAIRRDPDFAGVPPMYRRDVGPSNLNATITSMNEGGTLLEYEDEDPEVRRRFKEALQRTAVPFQMPEEIYEAGAAKAWANLAPPQ